MRKKPEWADSDLPARTRKQILTRLVEINADERYHYPTANTDINAPLALIQLSMESEARALAWVLGIKPPPHGPNSKAWNPRVIA